jgi:hypothetical protein
VVQARRSGPRRYAGRPVAPSALVVTSLL